MMYKYARIFVTFEQGLFEKCCKNILEKKVGKIFTKSFEADFA